MYRLIAWFYFLDLILEMILAKAATTTARADGKAEGEARSNRPSSTTSEHNGATKNVWCCFDGCVFCLWSLVF